ncbi:methionine aminotransferase [Hymenobacter koreensis]|uniref:Pyridoxal phosphate-dependent aminotransferase n=1 Tax=Hymenobacter koreensis TaxID=1084523 RepID=A0ABP8JMY0_9BACT
MLTSKLPDVGTSIFAVMSQLAAEHGAINLAQGFPDFNPPAALTEALVEFARGSQHQYAPMPGLPLLRERIAAKTARVYHVPAPDPATDITITSGATEALYAVLAAVVQPGDEVLVLEPAYDLYGPAIRLQGGVPVYVPLTAPTFRPDWQRVADAITPRTRLVMANTPHNPSGAVFSDDDWQQLAAILAPTHALLLSDEVYEHMTFDEQPHRSALQYPSLRERAFVLSSFGKTYHATGWKVGYCVAPPQLSAEVRRVHQFVTFSVSTLAQLAITAVIEDSAHYQELPAFMQAKRDLFGELMQHTRFELLPTSGSYFQLARYDRIAPGVDDVTFARRLTTEHGVAVVPVSAFYHNQTDHGLVRFCFAKQDSTLRAAAQRLHNL